MWRLYIFYYLDGLYRHCRNEMLHDRQTKKSVTRLQIRDLRSHVRSFDLEDAGFSADLLTELRTQ